MVLRSTSQHKKSIAPSVSGCGVRASALPPGFRPARSFTALVAPASSSPVIFACVGAQLYVTAGSAGDPGRRPS